MEQKDVCSAELGFKDFEEYKKSYLWIIIRKHILHRDACICRGKYCKNRASKVVHLAYTVPILLGKSPHCLVSVCPDCEKEINESDNPLQETIYKLTETQLVKGVSIPTLESGLETNMILTYL